MTLKPEQKVRKNEKYMKHIDLFSGIGGFALAADRVWPGIEHTFVEYDPFCQAILKKHYPNSTIHGDIRQFIADTEREGWERELRNTEGQLRLCSGSGKDEKPFILTGGFPCQPFSVAGRRKGTDDDRYLWREMFRVIQLYHPTWVIAENVAGLNSMVQYGNGFEMEEEEYSTEQDARASCEAHHQKGNGLRTGKGVLGIVVGDLEREGYSIKTFIIPACAVGAPHRRDRVWIVAHAPCEQSIGGRPEAVCGKERGQDDELHAELTDADSTAFDTRCEHGCEGSWDGLRSEGPEYYQADSQRSSWQRDWREVAITTCHDGMDDGLYKKLHSLIIGGNDNKQINSTEADATDGGFTRESLRALWEHRASATPSSFLYQLGLCDTLPDVSCESRQERWYTQEQAAKEMRGLWQEFYSKPHKEQQDVQQRLLDRLGEIERNEAVVIKKDDKGVWGVWYRVYLPTTSTNNMFKELCKQTGVAKEEIEIISGARHRKERLKACGNAIVPQVAEQVMRAMV